MEYLPPALAVEGTGVKRGLTAVEAAILLEAPLNKVMTMILFGLVKKGVITVLTEKPLKVQAADPLPQDVKLWYYERRFLQAIGPDGCDAAAWGSNLGKFIAQLHARTYQHRWFADHFANLAVQQTRLEVQYNGCLEFCRRAHMPDADIIARRCRRLGQKFNTVGKCLVMGDLWPYSILPGRNEIRLIDWELTHFGRPAQDVAHLAAHLWMMSHRAAGQSQKRRIDKFRVSFIDGYLKAIARQQPQLMTSEDKHDFQIHFGAEILARTLGHFQKNYLYDGLSPQHPVIQQAAEEARQWIQGAYDPFDIQCSQEG